jgi:hypothetical protein
MGGTRPRVVSVLIGTAAAVGAFGAAAIISAATAPTAHADDFTDIVNDIESDFSNGQTAFNAADTDFANNDVPAGLAALIDGTNDDFVATSDDVFAGTVDALTNQPVIGPIGLNLPAPTDFAAAVSAAEYYYGQGQTELADAATALSNGDYATAAGEYVVSSIYGFSFPLEELVVGASEAVGF